MADRPREGRRRPSRGSYRAIGRSALFGLGWLFFLVGIAGLVLPLVPGTLFLILSAACFARSSPRFESWLLNHSLFGPPIRQWRKTGAISLRAKWIALASLAAGWLIVLATGASAAFAIITLGLYCAVAGYIFTRPSG